MNNLCCGMLIVVGVGLIAGCEAPDAGSRAPDDDGIRRATIVSMFAEYRAGELAGVPEIDASALPFPLLPSRRIWRREPLKIYLELYHLALDAQNVGRFRASFRVLPLRDDGEIDRSRDPVTLTVDLESQGATYQESFVIALRDQELGHYRLEVEVTVLQRGVTRTRTAPLEIIR